MTVLRFVVSLLLFSLPAIGALAISRKLARTSMAEWVILAWIPPVPLVAWAIYITWETTRDPTSHNLWPFELIMWIALSALLFGGFLGARRLFVPTPRPWQR